MSQPDRIETVERIVNLAMYLSAASAPVSWEDIRTEVAGYPPDQNRDAFLRMFERDKKQLRESGLVIDSDAEGRYLLDEAATFTTEVTLSSEESAALRAAVAAFIDDPAFPFSEDLRLAMAKLGSGGGAGPCSASRIADETPERQGRDAAIIADASQRCKRVAFEYTTAAGQSARREVEPYGAFVRDGRWYLVGRDADRDAMRTFSLSRAECLEVNQTRQATPDFERPSDFDIASFVMLPFQLGTDSFEAVLELDADLSWRAESLLAGHGGVEQRDDGTLRWTVQASNPERLARWVIENGPGIAIDSPPDVMPQTVASLEEVRSEHV